MADAYSKLHLDFTDDGTLKVITEGTLSLQKTVRALRQELTLPIYSPEQRTQIRLALAEAEAGLQNTKVQSRELFGQLALIPGPIGQIAGQTQNLLMVFRAINQLTFKDLQAQFKILKESLFGSVSEISNAKNIIGEVAKRGGGGGTAGGPVTIEASNGKQSADIIAQVSTAAATGTLAFKEFLIGANQFGKVIAEQAAANLNLVDGFKAASFAVKDAKGKIVDYGVAVTTARNGTVQLTKQGTLAAAEMKTISEVTNAANLSTVGFTNEENKATKALYFKTLGLEEDTTAQLANNAAVDAGTKGFKYFGAAIGTALLVVLAAVTAAVVKYKDENDKLRISEEELGRAIENNNTLLELDEKDFSRRAVKRQAELQSGNASEINLRKQNYQDAKDNYDKITQSLNDAVANQNKAMKESTKDGGFMTAVFGVSEENLKKQKENLEKANKQVDDLTQKQKDAANKIYVSGNSAREEIMRRSYQNQLRDLDTKIELEIKKEDTSKDALEKILKKRNKLVDDYNVNIQLSDNERELRRKQNEEKVTAALVDDTVRRLNIEIDMRKKLVDEAKNGSAELYSTRREIATLEYNKALEEAKKSSLTEKDEKIKALIKFNEEMKIIKEDEIKYGVDLLTKQLEAEMGKSSDYFDKERELENARNKQKLADKKLSDAEIEAENLRHQKKLTEINVEEDNQRLKLQQMFTEGAKNLQKMTGAWWTEFDQQFFDERRINVKNQYDENIKLTKEGSEERRQQEFQLAQDLLQIDRDEMDARKVVQFQQVEWAVQIADILVSIGNTFFKNNKDIQHALVAIQGAAQIAKIIASTEAGLAAATAEAAAVALIPGVGELAAAKLVAVQTATRISEGIAIAGVVAAQAAAWAQIDGGGASGGGTGNASTVKGLGSNYGDGGMINGPSHAQGGVPVTAEGGEAIMTRGAVTAFGPLLSMLNQAGGGVSFGSGVMGKARYDAPKTTDNSAQQPIIKTYVVEGELTSAQYKAARLKDLSTL